MKRIPLTQGQFAIVSDTDYSRIGKFKWCAVWSPESAIEAALAYDRAAVKAFGSFAKTNRKLGLI